MKFSELTAYRHPFSCTDDLNTQFLQHSARPFSASIPLNLFVCNPVCKKILHHQSQSSSLSSNRHYKIPRGTPSAMLLIYRAGKMCIFYHLSQKWYEIGTWIGYYESIIGSHRSRVFDRHILVVACHCQRYEVNWVSKSIVHHVSKMHTYHYTKREL